MSVATTVATLPPAWEDTIVPTLRKRLQDESRILAKRISAASIGSDDGPNGYKYPATPNTPQNNSSATYYSPYQRPSAIPRPSMQSSRPSELNSHATTPPFYKRPRTNSQPFSFEPSPLNSEYTGPRSSSPQSIRPTRIPKKSRNGSVSSHTPSNYTNSTPIMNGRRSKDTYYAVDAIHDEPRHKPSVIANEQPPFPANLRDNDVDSTRLSSESEEHPYEHWYRGDVSRNGGVGEMRVAKRKEMLEIASYGHAVNRWDPSLSRSVSKAGDFSDELRQRRRADSIGATGRESLYLDNEHIGDDDMVLDERPLTDAEDNDVDPEQDMRMSYYFDNRASQSPSPPPMQVDPAAPPSRSQSPTKSRIPAPTSHPQLTDSIRTPSRPAPPQAKRGVSNPLPSSASTPSLSSTSRVNSTRARSQTPTRAAPGTQTSRSNVKSPTKSTASSSKANGNVKKSKGPPPRAMKKTKEQLEKDRRSVAMYPTPVGEDIEHAIPVWSQPVRNENWDEVVLPVVARKKGLDELYEMTDGSPKPKVQEPVIEPAPGTFGWDHIKYKPPRADYRERSEAIQLDAFVHKMQMGLNEDQEPPSQSPQIEDHRPIRPLDISQMSPPTSPAPFSHYSPNKPRIVPANGLSLDAHAQTTVKVEEDSDAGCCKCVIM